MATKHEAANEGIKTLAHTKENYSFPVGEMNQTQILDKIKEDGHKLGKESLRALLAGEKTQAGDFEMILVRNTSKHEKKAASKPAAKKLTDDSKADDNENAEAKDKQEEGNGDSGAVQATGASKKDEGKWPFPTSRAEGEKKAASKKGGKGKTQEESKGDDTSPVPKGDEDKSKEEIKTLHEVKGPGEVINDDKKAPEAPKPEDNKTPEPQKTNGGAKVLTPEPGTAGAAAPVKPGREKKPPQERDTNGKLIWVHPTEPTAIRKGTKIDIMFKLLCRKQGVSKAELNQAWADAAPDGKGKLLTEGGLGSILFWEPKAHGYSLFSYRTDDEKKELRYELHYLNGAGRVEEKDIKYFAAPAPAAPSAPKEPKAAAAPKASADPMAGVVVSGKRRAADNKPAEDKK